MATIDPMKPIKTPGLYDFTSGQSFESFKSSATPSTPFPSIAPAQVDDSVTGKLDKILKSDSALMTAARTEGLKAANSRGLLNSSMAVGATQDAMLRAALPIASQEASQAYGANQGARAFEYAMAQQDREIGYQASERALDRSLQEKLASWNLASSDRNAAASMLVNMEGMYQSQYSTIMNNPNMSADDRANFLVLANRMRDKQLNLVEQMFDINLSW